MTVEVEVRQEVLVMVALLARRLLGAPRLYQSWRWAAASRTAHTWTTARVRDEFLTFFQERGHEHLPSSSLVPTTDPTLLFTNAGMVQFKEWFADTELASSSRVVTAQRCMRAGGKHNDLDNVGQTARHHTLFEMLGNFSFSDAEDAAAIAAAAESGKPSPLKTEAILHAWSFLTEVLRLPPEKLMVTVHENDKDAEHIWRHVVGLPASQVAYGGEDNWWSMGAGPGPVGPCTEIFWDQEQEVDGERWLELWNLVFMEHHRDADGGLTPLPRPCVDTGMGLERIVSVLQSVSNCSGLVKFCIQEKCLGGSDKAYACQVPSNYHTDGFDSIFAALGELTSLDSTNWRDGRDEQAVAARVIADHVRAICFLLCDGVVPNNVGRGYTFRRVLRRAVRHGNALGLQKPFLSELIPVLSERADEWPHIAQRLDQVVPLVRQEEELFLRTMSRGLELLAAELAKIEKGVGSTSKTVDPGGALKLSAETTFQLYDTYGFPFDLTATIASERGFEVDMVGAAQLMEQQRKRARASGGVGEATKSSSNDTALPAEVSTAWQREGIQVHFTGHGTMSENNVRVLAVEMDESSLGAWVALERSPFYPTGGGQIGDVGYLAQTLGEGKCEVIATVQPYQGAIACRVVVVGQGDMPWLPIVGECVDATVAVNHRRGCSAHHTATHMLAAALRAVLPTENVLVQAGSEVSPRRLRYDCSGVGSTGISADALERVTELVNDAIRSGLAVRTQEMPVDEAVAKGAVADFGEKYGDTVRVVTIGDGDAFSATDESWDTGLEQQARRFNNLLFAGELCGGTHVSNTSAERIHDR